MKIVHYDQKVYDQKVQTRKLYKTDQNLINFYKSTKKPEYT